MGHKCALLLLATVAAPLPAMAQTASDSAASTDIVVTAQKTSQRAQDVPLVVNAVQGKTLTEYGATRIQDIAASVPALQVDTLTGVPGVYSLTLRGINTGSQASSTVATYIDDVPIGSTSSFAASGLTGLDLFPYDLERVEILEGPQGTLYGASSMGGLLKYVTRTPSLSENRYQFGGDVLGISDGSKAGWTGCAAVDLVVSPGTLAVGISGTHQYYPGYIDDVATGQKDINYGTQNGARAVLYWKPVNAFSLKLQGLYNQSNFAGNGTISAAPDGTPIYGDYKISSATGQGQKSTTKLVAANLEYDFGPAKLVSVSSYSDVTSIILFDDSASFEPIFGVDANFASDYHTKKFTQEVRLASPTGNRFHWLIGSFYTAENLRFEQVGTAYAPGTTNPVSAFNPLLDGLIVNHFHEWAIFANATFNITDQWDVSGGLRYSHNHQTVSETAGGFLFGGVTDNFGSASSSDDATTFSASTSYHLTKDAMLYARVSSGYRPGGPNFRLPGFPAAFGPDRLTDYETGLKSDLFDRRLMLNLTGFYIDWNKIQLQGTAPNGLAYEANGGRATSKGAELTTNLKVSPQFTLGGGVTYTDAVLKDDAPVLSGKAGDDLPFTAHWAASITADYVVPIDSRTQAHLGAAWRYTGPRNEQFPDAAFFERLRSYDTLNLIAGVTRGPVSANLFVRNIANSHAYVSWVEATGPVPLQPRTIGLSLDVTLH